MLKLSRPYIPDQSFDLIKGVLDSGHLIQGPNVLAFEQELSSFLDVQHVIAVSSGTAALHLALISMGIGTGDEVIVPAYSFPAVANAVELTGATPVFVDIRLEDYCIDTDKIEQHITRWTKAIMPVHEFGQSAEIDTILQIAHHHKLLVIEDAACAIGTQFHDRFAGTFGDVGCLSFHPRKILTTGEGGAVITKNPEVADALRKLRNHGITPSSNGFDFTLAGFNYRLTDFQAAIGLSQLPDLPETLGIHRSQAAFYYNALRDIASLTLMKNLPDRKNTYQTFHILLESHQSQQTVKQALHEKGIETNIGAYAIPGVSYYQHKYRLDHSAFVNASIAFECGLALPVGRHLDLSDLQYISETLHTILQ